MWIVLALAGAAGTSVELLFLERGMVAALWVLAPLALLLVASARYPVDPVVAVVQIVIIAVITVGAGGHLSGLGWGLSIWDAVLICELMGLAVGIAAVRHPRERWYRDPGPSTPIRGPIARAGPVLTWTAFAITCCVGGLFALMTYPVRPPDQLVYAMPDGVSVADERTWCEHRPAGTCAVSLRIDGSERPAEVLRDELAASYFSYYGWSADSSQTRCRTIGWVAKEHLCVSVTVGKRYVIIPPTLDLQPTQHPGLLAETDVTVAVTYW